MSKIVTRARTRMRTREGARAQEHAHARAQAHAHVRAHAQRQKHYLGASTWDAWRCSSLTSRCNRAFSSSAFLSALLTALRVRQIDRGQANKSKLEKTTKENNKTSEHGEC